MALKLEVGKYYRTRDGRKVGPIEKGRGIDYPFQDIDGYTYMVCGTFYRQDKPEGRDLIAEWPSEGPVRTVTRKEIVPGEYGPVVVKAPIMGGDGLILSMNEAFWGASTAPELRAAIATLTEIADALEESE